MSNIERYGGGVVSQRADVSRRTGKTLAAIGEHALVADAVEQGRAWIAHAAMTNVAALSSEEAAYAEMFPHAVGRFSAIADAYTLGAVRAIGQWNG